MDTTTIDITAAGVHAGTLVAGQIPERSTVIGTVTRAGAGAGGLVRLANDVYAEVTGGVLRSLDQFAIIRAVEQR